MEEQLFWRANRLLMEIIRENDWIDAGPQDGLYEAIMQTVKDNEYATEDDLREKVNRALSNVVLQGKTVRLRNLNKR